MARFRSVDLKLGLKFIQNVNTMDMTPEAVRGLRAVHVWPKVVVASCTLVLVAMVLGFVGFLLSKIHWDRKIIASIIGVLGLAMVPLVHAARKALLTMSGTAG